MATLVDVKVADDSSTPPSYHKVLARPIQCDQSSIFSFGLMKKKRAAVLSRIRDIVLAPDYIPCFVVPKVIACAATLPVTEFSKILTQLNIEGHTAPYWAIVNNRPHALWAFIKFISGTSPSVSSDLRIACMITNDHSMFKELNFGNFSEDRRSRCILGRLPDEIQVHTRDKPIKQFDVVFRIKMFQKRLRTATDKILRFEFVAGGRIWWFSFYIPEPSYGSCRTALGLSQHSYQARFNAVLLIEAHSRKPGRAAPPEALKIPLSLTDTNCLALVPWQSPEGIEFEPPKMTWNIWDEVGDWVLYNNTEYVDDEGTLNAKLQMTLL
ncbi:uncharacterized protein HD556DRAFT_511412 [Suillus plorans]|uniref:Uncharacterized protein n=1 Tax=Suillus plorans TaxID=116603 RepID=A0A9P7DI16_9AGAM|nr:uncharacterized protein HD556DRAFT_511412 [Suillus plorans]KAG1793528.1 hypothetical protein HD556DRAFT_511412 [Suillus plorans]